MITIKLDIPEGYEIDLNNSCLEQGEIKLKKKEIEYPTTNDECINFAPDVHYYIGAEGIISNIFKPDFRNNNAIATKELAEAFLALMQLVKFRDIWNGEWKPDWKDNNVRKYSIILYRNVLSIDYVFNHQTVLCFKDEKLVNKFFDTFKDLLELAKPLL
jgi:hypothetical protein